jgi:uncharacterized protein
MAVLIFKAIEKCNSNCLYCDTITNHQQAVMGFDKLEVVFQRINEYLLAEPEESLTFTWHGGEVCLLGAAYIRQAKDFQDQHCPQTKDRIHHEIQSNLTLLTEDLAQAFAEIGITGFGTSFEPLPNIRGFGAKRDSDAYNKAFFRSITYLNERKISWGIIYVVHKQSLGKGMEIWNYLNNLNPNSTPSFVMMRSYNDASHDVAITEEEYVEFLGEIFPHYWKHRSRYGSCRPFNLFIDTILDGRNPPLCESAGACAHRWLFIGPEGEYGHCGISGDYRVFQYGEITTRSIQEVLDEPTRHEIAARQQKLPEGDCKDCRFWGMCHGGCPVGAFLMHQDLDHAAPSCKVTKLFGEKYFEPITGAKANLFFSPSPSLKGESCV